MGIGVVFISKSIFLLEKIDRVKSFKSNPILIYEVKKEKINGSDLLKLIH